MATSDVEIIVLKQLASSLAMPMFVIGPAAELLFYNESAEPIVGRRFDESGELGAAAWQSLLKATDVAGQPLRDEERGLVRAIDAVAPVPVHNHLFLTGLDGKRREIEGTSIPLTALDGRRLGALALFWDVSRDAAAIAKPTHVELDSGQHPVETILTRRLASRLGIPIYLVDEAGRLLYFNEAAEPILGRRFGDLHALKRESLYGSFQPTTEDGSSIAPDDHPLSIARLRCQPVHRRTRIKGLDGVSRLIEVTAIPLVGQSGRMLGAFGVFWETPS